MQCCLVDSVALAVWSNALQTCTTLTSLNVSIFLKLVLICYCDAVLDAGNFEWHCVTAPTESLIPARYAHSSFFYDKKVSSQVISARTHTHTHTFATKTLRLAMPY
jgi:hypothetical protein